MKFPSHPHTFAAKGYHDYKGKVNAVSMTAHPKFDYAKNELLSFSYRAQGDATTDFVFHVVDQHGDIVQEAKFVPRGPGEGNGYLVLPVNRVAEMRSDLAVLDAMDIERGPIALFKMPIRVKASGKRGVGGRAEYKS